VIFPGCAARAALKAALEKGPPEHWIIGSTDVATPMDQGWLSLPSSIEKQTSL
jgi:hypothetical protein